MGSFIIFLHQTTTWPVWATETLSETITAHLRSGVGSADRKKSLSVRAKLFAAFQSFPGFIAKEILNPRGFQIRNFLHKQKR